MQVIIIHEVFHQVGYDERYELIGEGSFKIPVTHEGMSGDVVGSGSSNKIHDIHFTDLVKFSKKNGNGTYGFGDLQIDDTKRGRVKTSESDLNNAKDRTSVPQ